MQLYNIILPIILLSFLAHLSQLLLQKNLAIFFSKIVITPLAAILINARNNTS